MWPSSSDSRHFQETSNDFGQSKFACLAGSFRVPWPAHLRKILELAVSYRTHHNLVHRLSKLLLRRSAHDMSHQKHHTVLNFDLHSLSENSTRSSCSSSSGWGPRVGKVSIRRQDGTSLEIQTPGLITSTSRGIVPHLARDTTRATKAIAWVHIPFESL